MRRLQAARIDRSAATRARRDRDEALRTAQEQAFEEVRRAPDADARRKAMHKAVEELVDACEAFIEDAMNPRLAS